MIITYFRSSSYNRHDDCEQAYYLEYILGIKGSGNFKADIGTTVHKILEVMAIAKKAKQDGKRIFIDDVCGKLSTTNYDLDEVTNKVYDHYAKMWPHHPWADSTRKDVHKLVNAAITCQDGAFNPATRTIIEPEQHFDITIDEPWAKYEYDIPGEGKVSGNLALKGTIDLLTEVAPGIIEIVDWKTGARKNWTTGEEKTYEKLCADPQLMLYYYAVRKLYPKAEQVMLTIFFIKDGGPFTVCFSDDDMPKIELMIREKFNKIRATRTPRLSKTWKCKKLCHLGKNSFETLPIKGVKPIIEFRQGQATPRGQPMTCCAQIEFELSRKGMEKVTAEYKNPEHKIGTYHAPGG